MKSCIIIILFNGFGFINLSFAQNILDGLDVNVWSPDRMPKTFIIDTSLSPTGTYPNASTLNALINSINNWNTNESLGQVVSVTQGDFSALSSDYHERTHNNVNEISFNVWNPIRRHI